MARYDSFRKLARNAELIAYREAHPEDSLQEIATIFSTPEQRISAQRVWAILNVDKMAAYRRNRREAAAK